jgi:hypothetical protein
MPPRFALITALLLVAVAGCHSTEGGEKTPDPELARLHQRVADFEHRLAAIRSAAPDAQNVEDQACPDDAIEKQLHGKTGSLLLAEYQVLGRYAGKSADDRGRWKFLTTPALRVVPPLAEVHTKKQTIDALWNIKKVQRDYAYIAVLRSSHRELPRMDGRKYHPGAFSGGLFIFDLESGKPLCRARVDAHSDNQVAGVQGQPPAEALWNDFELQLRHELDRALSRVSRQLELDFG